MSKWIRDLTCVVSGVVVKDLRIEFNIHKTIDGSPNAAKVRIFNLNQENRERIREEFDNLLLFGGYRDGAKGTIFTGKVTKVNNKRAGVTNIVTEIECAEANDTHRFSFVDKTFKAEETTPLNIIKFLHSNMAGVKLGQLVGVAGLPPKKRPITIGGHVFLEMNKVCKDNDLHWSIQNNVLEVIPYDGFINEVVVVSKKTGMVESPEPTELGVKVKTLMDFSIVPNRLIDVYSEVEGGKGLFRVNEATYTGNNIDGQYVVDIVGARVEGGVKQPKYKKDT